MIWLHQIDKNRLCYSFLRIVVFFRDYELDSLGCLFYFEILIFLVYIILRIFVPSNNLFKFEPSGQTLMSMLRRKNALYFYLSYRLTNKQRVMIGLSLVTRWYTYYWHLFIIAFYHFPPNARYAFLIKVIFGLALLLRKVFYSFTFVVWDITNQYFQAIFYGLFQYSNHQMFHSNLLHFSIQNKLYFFLTGTRLFLIM